MLWAETSLKVVADMGGPDSCMVFLAGLNRVPIPHTLHGRTLKHKMPFIMNSMQIAPLAQALGPGNPCAPAQHNRQ